MMGCMNLGFRQLCHQIQEFLLDNGVLLAAEWILDADNDIDVTKLGLLFPEKFTQHTPHVVATYGGRSYFFAGYHPEPRMLVLVITVIDDEIRPRNPLAEIKNG